MGHGVKLLLFGVLAGSLAPAPSVFAQDSTKNQTDQKSAKQAAKQKAKSDKDLFKELDSKYKKWLNEDVVYIITPEERIAFVHLQTNEEREQFIEQFWQRRNPDRRRIYIMWGAPDEIESHPSGGSYDRPASEGGGTTSTYPFEDWRYRYLEGIGEDVNIEFVDPTMTGEYHLTLEDR